MSRKPLKVCFVAPHGYPLFNPAVESRFGGIEVQAHHLAAELGRRTGFDVSFIVRNHGTDETEKIGDVTIVPYIRKFRSIFRLFHRFRFGPPGSVSHMVQDQGATMDQLGDDAVRAASNGKGDIAETALGANNEPMNITSGGSVKALPNKALSPDEEDDFWELNRKAEMKMHAGKGRVVRLNHRPVTRPLYHIIMGVQAVVDFFRHYLPFYFTKLYKSWVLLEIYYDDQKPFNQPNSIYLQNMFRVRTYKDTNADVYISFGMNDLTAELVGVCRLIKKPVILFAASDNDFQETYFWGSAIVNYYGDVGDRCHFALMRANRIIVQNRYQKKLAKESFHRDAVIIPNPIDLTIQASPDRPFNEREFIFWVGKADLTKQPQAFLALAKQLPQFEFFMVLYPGRMAVEEDIVAHKPSNLTIVDWVSHAEIPDLMERALVLVNSSRFEGFPNTFLEAGRAGTPILSLNVNPDGFLTEHSTGVFADGDIDAFIEGCRRLAGNEAAWKEASANALDYVRRVHDQAVCVDQLIDEIDSCLAAGDEPLVDLRRGGINYREFLREKKTRDSVSDNDQTFSANSS